MKFLRTALAALAVTLACLANAQSFRVLKSTFLDIRGTTGDIAGAAAAAADGGGYSSTYVGGLQLAKYDSAGALQWQQRLPMGAALQIEEGATGVYLIGGLPRVFPSGTQTYLAKFDFSGNRIFTQFFGGDPGLMPRQLMLDSSDNAFILASSPDGVYFKSAYLIKVDSKGTTLWQSRIGDYSDVNVERMHRDTAGNFYIAGSGFKIGFAGTEAFVAKLDPNGKTIWYYKFNGYPISFGAVDAVPAPDGSVYSTFLFRDDVQGPSTRLNKLSSAGTKLWSIDWAGTSNDRLAVDSSGNCFASASNLSYAYSTVKVNPSGTLLWNKPLLGYVSDMATDGTGNLTLLASYNNNPGVPGAMKVDPNGNTVWTLDAPDDSGVKQFSRGDIMVSRQYVDTQGAQDNTIAVIRRINPSKAILWTSNGITNDHASEYGSQMVGGVNSLGVTLFYSEHRYIGIDTKGQTTFDVPDGTPFNDLTEPYPVASQVLPTKDGGFISNAHPYKLRKYSSTGTLVWETPFSLGYGGYGTVYQDAAGALYLQFRVSNGQIGLAKLSATGSILWKTPFPALTGTVYGNPYTTVDPAGNVFTEFNDELWKLSSSGVFLWHTALPVDDYGHNVSGRLLTDTSGNVYVATNRYSSGTSQGWITKYTADGVIQFDSVMGVGDNSPMSDAVIYKGRLYSVGSTRINGITMMAVFCVDSQTGNIAWVATPNPGNHSTATKVMVDDTMDEIRVAGWRYANPSGYDYALVGMDLNGSVTRAVAYDSGFNVNEYEDGAGSDSQHTYYIFGRAGGPSGTYDYNVVKFTLPPPDWASVELPSVTTKMATGSTYTGTIRVTNMGLNTWTAAAGYKLDCLEPSTWSLTSVPLASGDSIEPGQSKVFAFTLTAPTTPNAYPLVFKMEHSGVQFDNASSSLGIQVMTQTNFASFIGQTVPTAMVAGQSYAVSVQYKNTGSNTWTPGTGYKLQSVNPLNNTRWGVNRLALTTSSVPPGGTGTFSGTVIAPMASGTYNFQWQPIQDTTGLAFGSPSTNVAVTVTNAGDAARYVSKTGPLTVNAGTDFYVQNTMLNVGSNTWSTSAGYSLRAIFNNWGAMNIFLPGSAPSVAPGAQVTFTKLLTAPLTPGTYPMQWQMLHGSTLFGDKTPYLNISVVQGPYNAKFNSQSVLSTSVAAGTTFGCTFSMQNLGTSTWDSTVKLASVGSSFGVTSLPVSGTVVQNANSSFSATFTAPTTPGTYTFQFRMQSPSGTYFGQPTTPLTIVVTPADAAQFISKTGPLTVNAGSDFYVQNTFKNTGTSTWSSASGFNLRSINPLDNLTWGRNRIYLPGTGSVAPGGSVTLTGLCTAPSQPGTYTMQWQMNHGSTLFGEKTPALTINVVQSADNAVFLTQTVVPTSVAAGSTFTVNIAMQNVGTATWGAGYNLVAVGSNNWAVPAIASGAVAPGAQHTFSATFTAPSTAGTYTFQMRMDHSGTKFGQSTKLVTVTVTGSLPNSSQYISSVVPLTVTTGTPFTVQYAMKNTGSNSWSTTTGYRLEAANPHFNPSWITFILDPVSDPVAPGQIMSYSAELKAPTWPGTYTMNWQMSQYLTYFGEVTPTVTVTVIQGPDNAAFVSATGIPSSAARGSSFTAMVTMKNIGTTTWTQSGGYALYPITNGLGYNNGPQGTVAPGASFTFTQPFTVPSQAGTYTVQFRMKNLTTAFGALTPTWTITVP